MIIISHRGWWIDPSEKNSEGAFRRSFASGFGIETDLRDKSGEIVISHDMPGPEALPLNNFLKLYHLYGNDLPLAFNVKADGLQTMLAKILADNEVHNFFFFDASIPDSLGYLSHDLPFFTRLSEYETIPILLEKASGVWIDCFERIWFETSLLESLLVAGKRICLVSPELHNRPYQEFWQLLSNWSLYHLPNVMLCTDHPGEAAKVFL